MEKFIDACKSGVLATVIELVDVVGVNCHDSDEISGLFWAIFYNKMQVFRYLLSHQEVDVNKINLYGDTVLHWAVWKNNKDALRLLLQRKDINLSIKAGGSRKIILKQKMLKSVWT